MKRQFEKKNKSLKHGLKTIIAKAFNAVEVLFGFEITDMGEAQRGIYKLHSRYCEGVDDVLVFR